MIVKNLLLFLCVFGLITVCAQSPDYIFRSGFEGGSMLYQYQLNGQPNPDYADIEGEDNGYDWVRDLDEYPGLGTFRIFYEHGDTSRSKAEIVAGPVDPSNHVLSFDLKAPHIAYTKNNGDTLYKGRIQAAINGSPDLKAFYFRVRLYIHPDIGMLRQSNKKITWFTIQEYWNNESNKDFPFRVTLNIRKDSGVGSRLFFGAHGQIKNANKEWESVWELLDRSMEVPLGEWFTLETHFLEGDADQGRFKVILIDEDLNEHIIADVHDYTRHPDDSLPDGVTSFNPMKLYTSGELINGLRQAGGKLILYWDDFEIWTDSLQINGLRSETGNNGLFDFYPNPAHSEIQVLTGEKEYRVEVVDARGIPLRSLAAPSSVLDIRGLPPAWYLIRFRSGQREFSRPVIIN